MTRLANLFLLVSALATHAAAAAFAVPSAEVLQPPTTARVAAICAAAQRDGWSPQLAGLREAAFQAYAADKLPAAEGWLNLARWAALLGESDTHYLPRWIQAITAAQVNHANMPTRYQPRDVPLGLALAPETQVGLLGDAAFSEDFFSLLSSVDFAPKVLSILDDLYRRDPVRFRTYTHLALAIAVVYDVPPPPDWPHAQVGGASLPRQLPAPADAFAWWIHQEKLGRLHQRLSRLAADELKFVVDAAAPFAELEWSQQNVNVPLDSFARAYTMIRYRTDRVTKNQMLWPGRTYRLAEVQRDGGICVDQAYFATEAGKARGVPTLLFRGTGSDGRHAWFGYLDGKNQWQLDAGRYAEQKFVTGYAKDPQTWSELSDHEVKFLAERFHDLPSFKSSTMHAGFAASFLLAGDAERAAVAARKAVNYERRNQAGWEALIVATMRSAREPKAAENVMREAALAFQRYPDLEALYVNRVSASLRARGQTSEAEAEERRIAHKNQDDRSDLSILEARQNLRRAMETQPLLEQIRAYNAAVDNYGRGAGIGFFDEIVVSFVEHLMLLHQKPEALRAIERARNTLKLEAGSQLASEFERLSKAVNAAK